jgi:hypothetical protein
MNFELPATGRDQAPAFLAARECRDWLVKVPLANPSQAQAIVLRQLGLLHHFDLPVAERLAILEELRGSVCRMQEDAAKGFAARPLPLAPPEQHALETSLAVWNLLALGYLRCFAVAAEGRGKEVVALQALVAQRTLSVFADWQVDLCRGEQLPDGSYWLKLHRILAAAEGLGVTTVAVEDPVRHGKLPTNALAAYAECNLLSTASLFELPARHMAWVARWARRWGGKLEMLNASPSQIRGPRPALVRGPRSGPAGKLPAARGGGLPLAGDHGTAQEPGVAHQRCWSRGTPRPRCNWATTSLSRPPPICCGACCNAGARAAPRVGKRVTRPPATAWWWLASRPCIASWPAAGCLSRPTGTRACCVREREEFETFGNLRQDLPARRRDRATPAWKTGASSTTGNCSIPRRAGCAFRGRWVMAPASAPAS